MRFLLTFLALFTPLAWLLWALAAGEITLSASLEGPPEREESRPVMDTSGIPQAPVQAELHRLENAVLQQFHPDEFYVQYYVRFDRIENVDGKPRIVGVSCGVFGEPREEQETIVARIEAPYLEGDPARLAAAAGEGPKELLLGGGVRVYDELGRLAAELDRAVLRLDGKASELAGIESDGEVFFRHADRHATLRARGFRADGKATHIELLADVRGQIPLGDEKSGRATIRCAGPATIVRDASTRLTTVTLRDAAHIEHPAGSGTCGRITITLTNPAKGRPELRRVVLDEGVTFALDPEIALGLERFQARRITLTGLDHIDIEGGEEPVSGVLREHAPPGDPGRDAKRRLHLEAFGLADRTLDIRTPRIEIRLDPPEENDERSFAERLASVAFPEGITARDREGPGAFDAGHLAFDARAGRLDAGGGVDLRSVRADIEAERVEATWDASAKRPERVTIGIRGRKRFVVRAIGRRLHRLARGTETAYTILCAGPIDVTRHGDDLTVTARNDVRVLGETETLLRCESVVAMLRKGEIRGIDARESVAAADPASGGRFQCERLDFVAEREPEVRLHGEPAVVSLGDRVVRAPRIEYSRTGRFEAGGGVEADLALDGAAWKFRATRAAGTVLEKGPEGENASLAEFTAEGDVDVRGPDGKRLEASRVDYDDESRLLVLRGSPARARAGELFFYEGPALHVRVVPDGKTKGRFAVEAAETEGAARLHVAPPGPATGGPERVVRWEVDLTGPARLEGDVVRVPDAAELRGYDAKGRKILQGRARTTAIDVERTARGFTPLRLRCTGGFSGETWARGKRELRLEAESLTYAVQTQQLAVAGPGRIWRGEEKAPTLFREAELELLEDGIRLSKLYGAQTPQR